jgi:hypothetical protein
MGPFLAALLNYWNLLETAPSGVTPRMIGHSTSYNGRRNAFYERTNYFARQRQCNRELGAQIDTKRLSAEAQKVVDALDAANARRDAIQFR